MDAEELTLEAYQETMLAIKFDHEQGFCSELTLETRRKEAWASFRGYQRRKAEDQKNSAALAAARKEKRAAPSRSASADEDEQNACEQTPVSKKSRAAGKAPSPHLTTHFYH